MPINRTPSNLNFLGPTTFDFSIVKLPTTNFFVQKCNLPGMSLPPVDFANPLVGIPLHGDHITFERFTIQFKVDEDIKNYVELHNWMRGLGWPNESKEFANLNSQPLGFGLYSDAELIVLNSKHRPNFKVTFIDAFPIELSGFQMEVDVDDIVYIDATATFAYTSYNLEPYRGG